MNKLDALRDLGSVSTPRLPGPVREVHSSFQSVLQAKRLSSDRALSAGPFVKQLDRFVTQWDHAHRASDKLLTQVPAEYRKLVELQYLVNDLNLRANLIAKAGETVTATINRIQQMGSN